MTEDDSGALAGATDTADRTLSSAYRQPIADLIPLDDFRRELTSADVHAGWTPIGRRALVQLLWDLAGDVGAFRRSGSSDWLCEQAANRIEVALNIVLPSVGEFVAAGIDVEEAFEAVEERAKRLRRFVGAEP